MRGLHHFVTERLRREQSGFTLIEVLVVIGLLAVVLGAALSLSATGSKVARKDIERSHAIEEVQNGVARMDRELRLASTVVAPASGASGNAVEFEGLVRPAGGGDRVLQRVLYRCDVVSPTNPLRTACFRYAGASGATPGGAGELIIDGIVNGATAPVFTANSASPVTYLSIDLRRSAAGTLKDGYDYAIRVEHGVHLRNLSGSL